MKWISTTDRFPDRTQPPKLFITRCYIGDQLRVRSMTANQLADMVKGSMVVYEWLDESEPDPSVLVEALKEIASGKVLPHFIAQTALTKYKKQTT